MIQWLFFASKIFRQFTLTSLKHFQIWPPTLLNKVDDIVELINILIMTNALNSKTILWKFSITISSPIMNIYKSIINTYYTNLYQFGLIKCTWCIIAFTSAYTTTTSRSEANFKLWLFKTRMSIQHHCWHLKLY